MPKIILSLLFFANIISAQIENHKLFSDILKDNVVNGYVKYCNLVGDKRLDEYLTQLAKTNPAEINNESDRLAFWINAYNAVTLKVIVDNYPLESINDLHFGGLYIGTILSKTIWDKDIANINGNLISLNAIEHDIIREEFEEPRIHFAVVCASISCPVLKFEAFEGYKLDEQLDYQAKQFFNDPTKNKFDIDNRLAELSKILDWYDDDFGDNDEELLLYISQFLPEDIANDITANTDKWEIDYLYYDWNLNEAK